MQKEQIDRFVTLASLQMPALVSQSLFQGAEVYEDYALLTFRLPKVYPIEELIDELEDQMELELLYHHVPSKDTPFGQRCCAYSNPRFGHMHKLNAQADDRMECDMLYVTLYDSLEVMGSEPPRGTYKGNERRQTPVRSHGRGTAQRLHLLMKEVLYSQLAATIHECRTWVDVLDTDRECNFMLHSGGGLHPIRCRVLSLVARGGTWRIPQRACVGYSRIPS